MVIVVEVQGILLHLFGGALLVVAHAVYCRFVVLRQIFKRQFNLGSGYK